jgi:hypothetical protein
VRHSAIGKNLTIFEIPAKKLFAGTAGTQTACQLCQLSEIGLNFVLFVFHLYLSELFQDSECLSGRSHIFMKLLLA